ncbi:MAG: PSD1 and planctomycete cytochrome C domain-containing protein [Rubripirellula sp.]
MRLPASFCVNTCMLIAFGVSAMCHAESPSAGPVDFNQQIRPVLTQYCTACHGGVKQAGDVSFVYADQVLPPDGWIVEPGDPESSVLIERIKSEDPDSRMPPPDEHPEPLPEETIELLERWVAEGAKWGDHWSMAPLSTVAVDSNDSANDVADGVEREGRWRRRPLDAFVLARLEREGLTPSSDAPPAEWLRRVSFDLIGLPPTLIRVESFTRRCREANGRVELEAVYEQEVDRLLASESFGERWATVWMDLARYADSKGFEKDPHRDMWPYRDWLIRAFNRDMPYDEFTIKQLAGDLLPNATADDLIATAFHRNTQTNTEGGTDDEEFRVAAVIDRINTTWTVWQATTFGCVQCHSHPYDPYKQEEYYACMALFNNTLDADLDTDYPTLKIPSAVEDIAANVDVQSRFQAARHARNEVGRELATKTQWSPLTPTSVKATGGELKVDGNSIRNAGGTFPVGVSYTIATESAPVTAIRIEIRPESDDPSTWPEQGSVLSQLKMSVVSDAGETKSIKLADVFVDAITGPDDPRSALNANKPGVGGYPKLHGPRWAVFRLDSKYVPVAGDTLRFEMLQSNNVTGNVATPLRNFQLMRSDEESWLNLNESEAYLLADQEFDRASEAFGTVQGVNLPIVSSRPVQAKRQTRLFVRGNWLEHGDAVTPRIPEALQPSGSDADVDVSDRLMFARWLVSKQNPLAARVWVNRIWSQFFGIGLVETLEDFGSSGLQPSHPLLLDHLAKQIRDGYGWQLKPFLRDLVLSSTYRQSSNVTPSLRERDAKNRWLARGPRTRLTAEMIRDQSLAVSGLIERRVGGPSVMPPQPDGVWQTVYSGAKWKTADGAARYRRALYTYWRRTSPYPSLLMFDSPTRDICSARRISTNTPLQALVVLNDPVYVECAEGLVDRAAVAVGADANMMIDWMFRAVTQREPSVNEQTELQKLYVDLCTAQKSEGDSVSVRETTDDRAASASESNDVLIVDRNAMSIVASTVLNLDRALTK